MAKFSVGAFASWACVPPVITAMTLWQAGQPDAGNIGYILPFFGIGILFVTLVAAMLIGLATGTTFASLLGVVVGIPLSVAAGSILISTQESMRASHTAARHAEFQAMLPALTGEYDAAIVSALGRRKRNSVPWIMCVLAADASGEHGAAFGKREPYVVSADALLRVAGVVASLELPINQKESSLALAFEGLVRRKALTHVPAWTALWDKAHGGTNGKTIAFTSIYTPPEQDCDMGSTDTFARDLVNVWGDKGINTWIATGHTFVKGQRMVVLDGARTPATLEDIVKSGVPLGPPFPPGEPEDSRDPSIASYVQSLGSDIQIDDDPGHAVALIARYLTLLPPSAATNKEVALACTAFKAARPAAYNPAPPDRRAAADAFEKLLCAARE